MKITIDSDNKTIQVHGTVPLKEFHKYMKDHDELSDYSIIGTEIIYQYYPYSPIIPSFNSPIYNPSYTTLTTTP